MFRQIHSFCLNRNATMTLFYVVTLAVCFLRLPVKTSSLSDQASKVTANNGALSKQIYAKVWTDNGGYQRLVFIKPHSCSPYPQPLCTQSNLCHSVPQTNKCCLCFSLTPLFCLYKYFSSMAQMLFCLVSNQTAQFLFFLWNNNTHLFACLSVFLSALCADSFIHTCPLKINQEQYLCN